MAGLDGGRDGNSHLLGQTQAWVNLERDGVGSDPARIGQDRDRIGADTGLDGLEEWQVWTDTGLERLSDSRDGGVEEQSPTWTDLDQMELDRTQLGQG